MDASDKKIIFMFMTSCFMEGMFFSFLGSFFPKKILSKGFTSRDVGIISGVFPLSSIIGSVFGRHLLKRIKLSTMFLSAFSISSGILIPFAFVMDIDNKVLFYSCCLLCRIVQGFGYVGIRLSTMIIITTDYKRCMATLVGLISTSFGVGFAVAPFFSSIVYQYMGIKYVFLILSAIGFMLNMFAYFVLRSKSDDENHEEENDALDNTSECKTSIKSIASIIQIYIPFAGRTLAALSDSFITMFIANFLMEQFDYGVVTAGTIMMIGPLLNIFGSILIGKIIDKYGHRNLIFVLGLFAYMVASVMVGPAPFLSIETTLANVIIGLFFFEIACNCIAMTSTSLVFEILRRKNIEESLASNSFMNSGLILANNFGHLVGPVVGGFLIDFYGFKIAALEVAVLALIIMVFETTYLIKKKISDRKRELCEDIERENLLKPKH